jgi:pyrimidine operon attenuation protein/uracil phosphoribosyltransferase
MSTEAISPEAMSPEVVEILSANEVRRTLTRLASQMIERSGDV